MSLFHKALGNYPTMQSDPPPLSPGRTSQEGGPASHSFLYMLPAKGLMQRESGVPCPSYY